MSLSVIQRLLIGFGVLLALLILIAGTGLVGLADMKSHLNTVTGDVANISDETAQLSDQLSLADIAVLSALVTKSEQALAAPVEQYTQAKQAFTSRLTSLEKTLDSQSEITQILEDFRKRSMELFKIAEQSISNHKQSLVYAQQLPDMKLNWLDTLKFAAEDIAVVKEDATSGEQEFALTYADSQMKTLLDTSSDYFNIVDLEELDFMRDVMDKGLNRINDILPTINDKAISETINELLTNYHDENGVLAIHYKISLLEKESETAAANLLAKIQQMKTLSSSLQQQVAQLRNHAKDQAFQASTLAVNITIIAAILSVLIAILIITWVSRSIKRPLAEVMKVLGIVAKGDFTQRINVTSKDEFGDLSRWVNDLISNLKEVITQVRSASDKVGQASHQTNNIAKSSQQIMLTQNDKTTSVASAMTQMATTVQQVSKNTEDSLAKIETVDDWARQSHDKMTHNLKEMSQLVSQLEQSDELVSKVSHHSQNIDQILIVIQGIAEQTNLLALNAAIEAARAGEQGRGFAVVADEVRTLATRTHESTEEIQTVIQQLQQAVNQTVDSMEKCRQNAHSSMSEATDVGNSLEKLRNMMSEIRDIGLQIATATEEQSLVAQDINQSIHDISDNTSNAASEALKGQQSSQLMTELAEQQALLVGRFRTE